MRRTRVLPGLLVAVGLVVASCAALDTTGDDIGELSIDGPAVEAADAPTLAAPTEAADDVAVAPSASPIATRSARIGDVDLSPPPAPVQLSLPSLGVVAEVVPVGVDPDGLMGVPDDVSTVGWYRLGAAPADAEGTIVVAGHVDDRVQGRGAFFDLRAAEVGDEVVVTDADGDTTTWRVTGRRTYDKASLPVDQLYERTGRSRLVLITCGGEFDRAARSYESNVVVEAEPVT